MATTCTGELKDFYREMIISALYDGLTTPIMVMRKPQDQSKMIAIDGQDHKVTMQWFRSDATDVLSYRVCCQILALDY